MYIGEYDYLKSCAIGLRIKEDVSDYSCSSSVHRCVLFAKKINICQTPYFDGIKKEEDNSKVSN